jgi:hypothetical protein
MKLGFGDRIMKKLLIAATFVVVGTSAALAQGYVYYGVPAPYVYGYVPAPAYPGPYVYYGYAPGGWYGANDISGNSVRQPNPRSTIEAVR